VSDLLRLSAFASIAVVTFWAVGLYDATRVRRRSAEFARIVFSVVAIAGMAPALVGTPLDRGAMIAFLLTGTVAILAARTVRSMMSDSRARYRRALIVGSGPQAVRVCRELSRDAVTPYHVAGFVDTITGVPMVRSQFVARRTLGTLDDLESILAHEHIDEVHVGLPIRSHYREIQDIVRVCERVGVKLMYRADVFDTTLARPQIEGSSARVSLRVVADGFPVTVKRAVDIVGALALLAVLSPLMIATAIAIRLTSDGPVLFRQERYGLNRRRFSMWKFRTMVQGAETLQAGLEARNEAQGPTFKIARDPRVTPIGRVLRRTSIDELPQLFNVLRGEMSLVGPRPLPARDMARFTRTSDVRRSSVRPGLTGLWQVSGRSNLDFNEWIRLDLHYIDSWSLRLDFSILARTIPAVLRGTGAV
jgi:exopolysaccharide biosynthesis polyprenyl glycosylphosphotransferase